MIEMEPNDDDEHVQALSLPCDIAGAFYPAADVDVFEFTAKKGEQGGSKSLQNDWDCQLTLRFWYSE